MKRIIVIAVILMGLVASSGAALADPPKKTRAEMPESVRIMIARTAADQDAVNETVNVLTSQVNANTEAADANRAWLILEAAERIAGDQAVMAEVERVEDESRHRDGLLNKAGKAGDSRVAELEARVAELRRQIAAKKEGK